MMSSSSSLPFQQCVELFVPGTNQGAGEDMSMAVRGVDPTRTNYEKPSVKPFLKFSIDRILGLTDESRDTESTKLDNSSSNGCLKLDTGDDNIDGSHNVHTATGYINQNNITNGFIDFSDEGDTPKYQWLQCTRYHPPKLQRSKKRDETRKRKLGRNPRVPFTQHQLVVLEQKFGQTHYLSSLDVAELSSALSLTETRVKIWFQNRRARDRREREAAQRNQMNVVQKTFQPLTIPSVVWPITAVTPSHFAQYQSR